MGLSTLLPIRFPDTTLPLTTDVSDPSILSDAPVQRLNFRTEWLWNYRNFDPTLLVFGFRAGFGTLHVPSADLARNVVPRNYFQFLGGSMDLRGFYIKELPRLAGAQPLTSGFLGLETRFTNILPAGFDPFVFFDLGALGKDTFSFDGPLYSSPGLGVRWRSPIGVIQATVGYGISGSDKDHFQPYFSLGEEF